MLADILISLILPSITIWTFALARKKENSFENTQHGVKILKNHILFAILGYCIGLIFVFFIGLGYYFNWDMGQDSSWLLILFSALLMASLFYGFLYITNYYHNHKVYIGENKISVINAWGKAKTINWDEIKDAEFDKTRHEIRLYAQDGTSVCISGLLYGLAAFHAKLAKHKPYLVARTLRPQTW